MNKAKLIKSPVVLLLALVIFTSACPLPAQVSKERQKLIDFSLELRGCPYKYAGNSPKGFDCSGFVSYCAKNALNKNLSRSSGDMYIQVDHIKKADREPGDLVFFAVKNAKGIYHISHVGIYLGLYTGDGPLHGKRIFLHAASDGPQTGVIVSDMEEKYWSNHFYGYGRFLEPSTRD